MTAQTLPGLESLASTISGDVITPDADSYDAARAVWNGMIDRRPAAIIRCRSEADVQAAVRFAAGTGLPIAVRGGGHNAAGLAVCDDGVVVDLSMMRRVDVDPATRTARSQGGATWADFDNATQAHGLATTGGAVSTTGVAGLTLGGGLGWLMRAHGLTCDNLESVRLVTGTGDVVDASESTNSELFWALRGGGGNFGAVTDFTFRLHPLSTVTAGMLVHPGARASEMLRFYREITPELPDEVTVFAALLTMPDAGPVAALAPFAIGNTPAVTDAVARLRAFGPPVADQVAEVPYTGVQTALDAVFVPGLHVYWRAHYFSNLTDEVLDLVVDAYNRVSSPLTLMIFEQLGGAVSRVADDATAYDHRSARYNLAIIPRWTPDQPAEPHIAWTRELWKALEPYGSGVYVNYLGAGEDPGRVRDAFSPAKMDRLRDVKRKYDPGNLFRVNQNIAP